LKGPLEAFAVGTRCEMCGAQGAQLEAAFDPSGEVMTMCCECRMGSAELREEERANIVKAARGALSLLQALVDTDKATPRKGPTGTSLIVARYSRRARRRP